MSKVQLPHLESNVTIACTRRCVHCNHFVPAQVDRVKASMITPSQLAEDLRHFGKVAHAKGYALIGGEPTLHPQLDLLCVLAKESRIADRLEIWTNGEPLAQQLPRLEDFWTAPWDDLVVSAYPGVLNDADILYLKDRTETHGKVFHLKDERAHPNFTRLLVPDLPEYTNPVQTQRRYDACWFKTYSRVLDFGYFYRCCTSPFIPQLLQGRPVGADGLKVDESLTVEKLETFLIRTGAMESCTRCAGRNTPEAAGVQWGEEKDPAAWLRKSAEIQERQS